MNLTFLGAAGTVTGSRYLVEAQGLRYLIDCGLFQGLKELRLRNWAGFPVDPGSLSAVVLTHAHIDHSGYLPVLVRNGFAGKVYCSPATLELAGILLPDAGHLQEEEARYANRRGFSTHRPALPLFTADDAKRALKHFVPVQFDELEELDAQLAFRLLPAGHILGASIVELQVSGRRLVFSGDLGRDKDPVMRPPSRLRHADWLVVESTYGSRRHPPADPEAELARHLDRALGRGGVVIIPTFAVGRAQTLLHFIARLRRAKRIPDVPVFLNSPMASDTTNLYCRFRAEHRLTPEECKAACGAAIMVPTPEASRALNRRRGPMIIVSASGMATGGRVLHHIKAFAPDPRNMVLFPGFQAIGTRGAAMTSGAEAVKIHGDRVPVRAEVVRMDGLSAHADGDEILAWLRGFAAAPGKTFITHGEPGAAKTLGQRIEEQLGWRCVAPFHMQKVSLPVNEPAASYG